MTTPTAPSPVVVAPTHRQRRLRQHHVAQTVLSMMSALIGISLGSATGISLAIFSTPASASISMNDLQQVHFIGNETPVSASTRTSATSNPTASPNPTANAQTGSPAQNTADASEGSTGTSNTGSTRNAADDTSTIPPAKVEHSPATENSRTKIPVVDDDEAPIHSATPAERLPLKRPVAHPLTKPPRVVLASDGLSESAATIDEASTSLDGDARPAVFYSEGDLTITDYNAANGTIETIDGRTFVLGLTVSTADATGWEDYRSSIHYRCSQDGSCTLTRSGVVAPNARLI
jgi:hypothetical protein